jgi:hypothetical protein
MTRYCVGAALIVLAGMAATATADDITGVNGYRVEARIFNDFPGSNLNINGTSYPVPSTGAIVGPGGPVTFHEQFAQGEPGNFANKHVAWLSNDAGASRFGMTAGQSWELNFSVLLNAPAGAPRKEGGIEIHNPRPGLGYTDEGQVLIATDGEVAVFGAVMPFHGFGPNTYTLGTTAQVTMRFFAPGTVDPTLGAYQLLFLDSVTGMHDSGLKLWGASEPDGTVGFNNGTMIGFKSQNQRNPFIADSSFMQYGNISIVPAPGAALVLGLAGLAGTRRRR